MKNWTDKDMLNFARIASNGTGGKYEGCRTLISKLARFKTIKYMEKFNGFEKHLILEGLELRVQQIKDDIDKAEAKDRRHIMTKGYIDMVMNELLVKLDNFSKKPEKG